MRKIISIWVVICMIITLSACNKDKLTSSEVEGIKENVSENNTSQVLTGGPVPHGADVKVDYVDGDNDGEQTSETTVSITEADKKYYIPTSITISLYDSDSYGVTWNTEKKSGAAVVQICEGSKFNASTAQTISATTEIFSTGDAESGESKEYFVHKAVLNNLKIGKTYTYRCYDKLAKTASEYFSFDVKNRKSDVFTFVHVTDSQSASDAKKDPKNTGIDSGIPFANTLASIMKNGTNPDFFLHTGDIVEWSAYESYWKYMLDFNKKYFATKPFMAISGNHEVSYQAGKYETYKHFNYKLPQQDTKFGIYYSFEYGNAKFVMINTNWLKEDKLTEEQYKWIVNELKNNNKKWLIVSLHNPLFSPGVYGSESNNIALALQKQLVDIFAKYKVDIVLQGHDHVLSKTYPIGVGGAINNDIEYETINGIKYATNNNGVVYLMNGTSGNQSRWVVSDAVLDYYEEYDHGRKNSWAEIEVSSSLLTIKVYSDSNGSPELWKSYGIKK